ncbi:MAG: lamin tail domain-containing protein [Bacteroidota bacterium]
MLSLSHERGFYQSPFTLSLSPSHAQTNIRYTTDGSKPSFGQGSLYTGPINISTTTTFRYFAWSPQDTSSVITHTYLFLADVINQAGSQAGYPNGMELDNSLTSDPIYGPQLVQALQEIPSVSIVLDVNDFNTIYYTKGTTRSVSIELLYPDGRPAYWQNGGVESFGNSTFNQAKKNFRFVFKQAYEETKFNYPLFGPDAADDFDYWVLRAAGQESFLKGGTQNLNDQFIRGLQLKISGSGVRGDFYHVYLNGIYWGVYNAAERPQKSFAESYFGGSKDDWNTLKATCCNTTLQAIDGNRNTWDSLLMFVNNYDKVQEFMDVDHFIDYVMVCNYGPHGDWRTWNTYIVDNPVIGEKIRFFVWDVEPSLLSDWYYTNFTVNTRDYNAIWNPLKNNADFRMRVADHMACNCLEGGALHPDSTAIGFQRIFDRTSKAYMLEAARWANKTRYDEFLDYKDSLMIKYFPNRTQALIDAYQNNNLYPTLTPVDYSLPAGQIVPGTTLSLNHSNPSGSIYYTLDGSDPRSSGGAISSSALLYNGPISLNGGAIEVKARVYDGGTWSANCPKLYYLPQNYSQLLINELHYHPHDTFGGEDAEFLEIYNPGPGLINLSNLSFISGIKYTFPIGSTIGEDQYWVIAKDTNLFFQQYALHANGQYQAKLSNKAELILLKDPFGGTIDSIDYDTENYWDWPPDGQGPSLELKQPSLDNALASSWASSWTLGGTPFAPNSRYCAALPFPFQINEINYHYETDPNSLDAGDWIELFNPMGVSRDISNWQLWVDDTLFNIPTGTTIGANGYYVLVRDQVDFLQSHPNTTPISPSFGFALPNNGARLAIVDDQGCIQTYLQYTDDEPWPKVVDGEGPSLSLIDNPANLTQPLSWQTSSAIAGTPGSANDLTPCQTVPIVINEIYYRGPSNPNPGDWLELYNPTAIPQDLSGWELHASNRFFRFPPGTLIPAFGYTVIVENQLSFAPIYPWLSNPLGNMGFGFDGDGEYVALFSAERCLVDFVKYNDSPPWPQSPDGLGPSLSLIAPGLNNELAGSWAGSNLGGAPFGTPGSANNIPDPCQNVSNDEREILINEIAYNSPAGYDGGNWLELHNPTANPVDLSFWELHEADSVFSIPPGTLIPAQGYLLIAETPTALQALIPSITATILGPTGFGFSNNGETLMLYTESSCQIDSVRYDDEAPWPPEADGRGPSLSLSAPSLDNALGENWERSPGAGTPGTANDVNPCGPNNGAIVINEINYFSPLTADAGDWLELHNTSAASVDVSNWIVQDQSNDFQIPLNTHIPAGGFLVLVSDPAAFSTEHPGLSFVGPLGFKLNNGGEQIQLLTAEYCMVDSIVYDELNPWPEAAFGQGPSLMLIDPLLNNELGTNWLANTPKGTPGQVNSFLCGPEQSLVGPIMWLRANEGFVTNGNNLTAWQDQSPNLNHASQTDASLQPIVITNDTMRFNGHPFVQFDGSNDRLNFDNTLLENTTYTMYGVVERITNRQSYFLGTQTNATNRGLHLGLRNNTRATLAQYSNDVNVTVPSYNSQGGTTPEIIRGRLDNVGKSISLTRNAQEYLGTHSRIDQMFNTGQGVVGAGFGNQFFNGYVAEVLVYQRPLDEFELRIVDNYFNLRYGVPISVEQHLIYSFANFSYMIAGIGNAPAQCVEQTQARSTSRGSALSMRNPSDLQAGEFLFWGHNDGPISEQAVSESPAYTHRIERVWRVHKVGELGKVSLYFDLSGSGISLANANDFSLIIDHSGGDFSNLSKHTNGRQIIGDQVWFTDVDFQHGDAFTLATQSSDCPVYQPQSFSVQLTCDPLLVGLDTTFFATIYSCDSLAIVETSLRDPDTTYVDIPVCDPTLQGTSSLTYSNQFGCDSVVISQQYLARDTVVFLTPVCVLADTGFVQQNYSNRFGCDSVVYEVSFFGGDTTRFYSETCDPALIGEDTFVYTNRYSCDSLVIVGVQLDASAQVPSPGLIGCNLKLWLRADQGLTLSGDSLVRWDDLSTANNDATQNDALERPIWAGNALNGQAVMVFDGNDDWLKVNGLASALGANSTIFAVFKGTANSDDGYYLSAQMGGSEGLRLGQRPNGNLIYGPTSPAMSSDDWRDRPVMFSGIVQTDQQLSAYLQGGNAYPWTSFTNSGADRASLGQAFSGTGNDNETDKHWAGQLAEIIVYDGLLWSGSRQRIETYLSIRYGLSIPVYSHLHYDHFAYPFGLVGLAKDSTQHLLQTQSRNQEGESIFSIANPDDLDQGEFLIMGHNGSSLGFTNASTNVPDDIGSRLARVWKVKETGELGQIEVQLDLDKLSSWSQIDSAAWVLLVDLDGDFSDASVIEASDPKNLVFSANLANGVYLSFARKDYIQLALKAWLQGPYDVTAGLMKDELRQQGLIPLKDPYFQMDSIEANILNQTGDDAIVDWVYLSLRPKSDSATITFQKAALIQKDGDIVATDGISPLRLWTKSGDYFIALHHRNHLGAMSGGTKTLGITLSSFDFRSDSIYGIHAQRDLGNGQKALWGGDTNGDGRIIFQGTSSEISPIFLKVLTAPANSSFARNYIVTAYEAADADLNGDVIFQGGLADPTLIFINVLTHPLNTSFQRNFVISAQLPD